MKIKQLSIFLQNRMGSLAKPLEVLTVADVNIRAMCMADTSEFGILRLRGYAAVSLSGGERRRVELARALAASPDFILLDEPFTGIDPIAIGEIKDNIRKLSEDKGLGVLITDHNPKATLSITDRAYVIFDGKIKIQGKSEEVAINPVAKEFYLGKDFTL